MKRPPLWLVLLAGGGAVTAARLVARSSRRRRAVRRVKARPHQEPAEFLALMERPLEDERFVSAVLDRVARAVTGDPADAGRLRPGDRWLADLAPDDADRRAFLELVMELERAFQIVLPDAELEQVTTLEELLRLCEQRADTGN